MLWKDFAIRLDNMYCAIFGGTMFIVLDCHVVELSKGLFQSGLCIATGMLIAGWTYSVSPVANHCV